MAAKKKKGFPRDTIAVRLTAPDQRILIERAAQLSGVAPSTYMRTAALEKARAAVSVEAGGELSHQLGKMLRQGNFLD